MRGELPRHWAQGVQDTVQGAHAKADTVATRKASQQSLERYTHMLPEMIAAAPT
jgi:transketolase